MNQTEQTPEKPQLEPPSVEQIQRDNPHIDGQTRAQVVRGNTGAWLAIVHGYSTRYAREARADYVWSNERERWELGAN